MGPETNLLYDYYALNKKPTKKLLNYKAVNLNGIYSRNYDMNKIEFYCKLTNECLSNSDSLATFRVDTKERAEFYKMQKYFLTSHSHLNSRILEPFYCILENDIPWTMKLENKTVLIISPFIESFKIQLKNKFQMFKDENKKIFLDNQKFVFYESFQTIAGNHKDHQKKKY